ncbi:MAG: 30S ribosomal protein S7, partial [Verrucomicrobiales bacterium]|nr:30S ribosomal protein S7 [Verrucomicrobiales bacterium]
MARRKRVYTKPVIKDAKYDSELVAHLINRVMIGGKKSLAERIVYTAIDILNEKSEAVDPLELFNRAIENAKPKVETKARRVGGATYQVPL